MSAVIRQLVARKRTAKADAEAFAARRDEIIADANGEQGERGEMGPMPDHQWKGTRLRFQKPDGNWGKYTDLQWPKGDDYVGTLAAAAPISYDITTGELVKRLGPNKVMTI